MVISVFLLTPQVWIMCLMDHTWTSQICTYSVGRETERDWHTGNQNWDALALCWPHLFVKVKGFFCIELYRNVPQWLYSNMTGLSQLELKWRFLCGTLCARGRYRWRTGVSWKTVIWERGVFCVLAQAVSLMDSGRVAQRLLNTPICFLVLLFTCGSLNIGAFIFSFIKRNIELILVLSPFTSNFAHSSSCI